MFKTIFAAVVTIAAALAAMPAQAENLNLPDIPYDKSKIYFAFVGEKFPPFAEALFCPVQGNKFRSCKSRDGYLAGRSIYTAGTQRTNPKIVMSRLRFKVSGRVALRSADTGNRTVSPKDVTYFFDARPGTVFVLGTPTLGAKKSVAAARRIMIEQYGENFGALNYVHMSAAEISCEGRPASKKVCTLGKPVPLKSVRQSFN